MKHVVNCLLYLKIRQQNFLKRKTKIIFHTFADEYMVKTFPLLPSCVCMMVPFWQMKELSPRMCLWDKKAQEFNAFHSQRYYWQSFRVQNIRLHTHISVYILHLYSRLFVTNDLVGFWYVSCSVFDMWSVTSAWVSMYKNCESSQTPV